MQRATNPDQDPATDDAVDVISMSLGFEANPNPDDLVSLAVDAAVDQGVVVAAAAGNRGQSGYDTLGSPGTARKAFTVGASSKSDVMYVSSSRGPVAGFYQLIKPDAVAPGVAIYSTVPVAGPLGDPSGYRSLSGTSMATPHIAGSAALIKQLHPSWSPQMIQANLMNTAKDLGANVFTQGAGRVQVDDAAGAQVVLTPGSVGFGVVDATRPLWTTSETLQLHNVSTATLDCSLAISGTLPPGVTTYLEPAAAGLEPGESMMVTLAITVDNRVTPYQDQQPGSYEGWVMAQPGAEGQAQVQSVPRPLAVPFAFIKGPASAPVLIAPADEGLTEDHAVAFAWEIWPGATQYQIQIDTSSAFTSTNLVSDTVASESYAATLGLGIWYWHIRGVDATGNESAYSAVRRFTVAEPLAQVTTDTAGDADPAITQTADGRLWVVWQREGELWHKTSSDVGTTWSAGTQLPTAPGGQYAPAVTQTSDGRLWVLWHGYRPGADIWYRTSDDGGASWSTEMQLTAHAGGAEFPAITQLSDGSLWAVWHSNWPDPCDIFYKTSSDGGATWSADAQITTDTSWDFFPAITQAADGTVWVVWTSTRSGAGDIWYKTTSDGGSSWSEATQLTSSLGGEYYPSIMPAADGTLWALWRSGNLDICYKTSGDGGVSWSRERRLTHFVGQDTFPDLAALTDGWAASAWQSHRTVNDDIWFGIVGQREDVDPPPYVGQTYHLPAPSPGSNDTVTVRAHVRDETAVDSVGLVWSHDGIPQTALAMYDDGVHDDAVAGDGWYGVQFGAFAMGTQIAYQVRAVDTDGNSVTSPSIPVSFTVLGPLTPTPTDTPTPRPTPAACIPALISPEVGAILDNARTDGLDERIWDFDWSECPGATAYHLYVIGATATIPLIDTTTTQSSYHSHSGSGYIVRILGWTWKVRAQVDGEWGPWSETRFFDVEPEDTDPPRPTPTTAPTDTATPTGMPTSTASSTPTGTPSPTPTSAPAEMTITLQEGSNGYAGSEDTHIHQYAPDTNFCSSNLLEVGYKQQYSALLHFDLSPVPAYSTIIQATLQVHAVGWGGSNMTIDTFRILRNTEPCQATWNQAEAGSNWGAPGCNDTVTDRGATPEGSVTTHDNHVWYDFDVTALLQEWVDGSLANNGLLLRGASSLSSSVFYFASAQNDSVSLRPKLVITYRAPTPTPTCTGTPTPTSTNTPTATPTALAPPTLLSPPDDWLTVDREVAFAWETVPGAARYRIQIDTSSAFTSTHLISDTVTSESYAATLGLGTWQWHVLAVDAAGGESAYSDIWCLTVAEPPVQVTTDAGTDNDPSITEGADGRLWVVWESSRSGNSDIWYKTSSDGGTAWSAAIQLTTDTSSDFDSDVTQLADGTIFVIWASYRSGNSDIWYRTTSDGGTTWSAASQLTAATGYDWEPAVTHTSDGTLWVVWVSDRSGSRDSWYTTSSDSGGTWAAASRLTSGGGSDSDPAITQAADGTMWVAWSSLGPPPRFCPIWYKTSSDGGMSWSAEDCLVGYKEGCCPALVKGAEATPVLMWCQPDLDSPGSQLVSGVQWTRFSGYDCHPDLAAMSGVDVAVVWESDRGANYNIWFGTLGRTSDVAPPPWVDDVYHSPSQPNRDDDVRIEALVLDETGVNDVSLVWTRDGTAQSSLEMSDEGLGVYSVLFGPFAAGTQITYQVRAVDVDGNAVAAPITPQSFEVVSRPPEVGTVTPSSGGGPAGVAMPFTSTWTDPDGWEDLKHCYFHIGASPSISNNVTLLYNASKDKLWIRSDDGSAWLGGFAPESANTVENSQAKVHCGLTTVQGVGDTLQVNWAIEFKPAFTGAKKTGLKCKDLQKVKAKGEWIGTWTIL